MAKTKISEFSTTPGNNTDINGINIAEGCAPSGINNAIRELMSDLKEWQSGAMDVYVIPQGTAAAPGIQLYGDLDTGLYGYAANQLGVAVGGASAGYFSSAGWNGNVNGTITGDINATTIDTTNIEVTNIKAKDGTAAITIADSTGVVSVSTQLAVDNLNLSGNTLSSSDTNGNIILAPNGTGDVYLDADTIRVGDSNTNVTITSNGTADLILNTNSGTNSGSITIQDGVNGNILIATNGTGQIQLTGDLDVANIETGAIKARDGTASATIADSTGVMTIASSVLTTTDINGGTIDNTVIGGATTAAGSFTTVTATQLDVDNLRFDANTISSTNTNGNIQIAPAGTGDVYLDADTVRIGDLNSNATLTTNGAADLILNTNSGSLSGSITIQDGVNGNIVIAPNGTGQVQLSGALDVTDIEVTNIKAKDGTAALSIADSTGVVSVSANPVLSGGTANGVVYLNASKAATSGSALVFDGTNLGLGGTPTATGGYANLNINGSSGGQILFGTANSYQQTIYNTSTSLNYYASNASNHIWSISAAERMRLNSTSLNIGGNFTSTNNTLQVTGNAAIGYTTAAPTTGLIVAGNVGIGTDAPTAKLDVTGTSVKLTNNATADVTVQIGPDTPTNTRSGRIGFITSSTQKNWYIANNWLTAGGLEFNQTTAAGGSTMSSTPSMVLDASGNLGLGVTPSVWSAFKHMAFSDSTNTVWSAGANDMRVATNYKYDGGAKYVANGLAAQYVQTSGQHQFYTAPNNTSGASAPLSFTQAMTLDASGNLLVGSTSTSGLITGQLQLGTTSSSNAGIQFLNSTTGGGGLYFGDSTSGNARFRGYIEYSHNSDAMLFGTAETERARITSGGYFKASNNGSYLNSTGSFHEFNQSTNVETLVARNTFATFTENVLYVQADRNTTNNSFYAITYYNAGAAASKFRVADSGNVTNTNGSYGTISDAKMKTDIVDAGSQWSDIKALRFRKFKMKDDPDQIVQLGVVAQEIEQVSPGLVEEHVDKDAEGNDLGTTTKSVKTSVLLMKAAVALQEAMARIEKLEAEVAALKGV